MKIAGVRKLRRATKRLQKRFFPRALILMYHRVAETELDPWALCVTPKHFAEHLEVLQKHARPMSLRELAGAHQNGNIPHRAVAITFDDGYADNLYNAKPLLERYKIPATVFVTSGYLEQNREFWWDELEQVLLKPGRLPEKLSLDINGSTHQWELGAAVNYSEDDCRRDGDRQADRAEPGSRMFFYYSVWQKLQPMPADERLKVLDEILTWAGTEAVERSTHRSLVPEEVRTLGEGEIVEIGAHTVTHPFLPAHSGTFQRDQIQQSKAYLDELLGYPVTSFAYPFGNYTAETVPLVREAGFTCACSCVEETVWRHDDCFQLPRFEVQNWNGEEFAKRLWRWLL